MKKFLLLLLLVCSSVFADGTSGWNYTTYYGGGPSPSITNRTVDTTGITTSINYNWGGGLVLDSNLYDGVIIHFQGYLRAPTTGTYQFGVASDDGNQLTINNTVVTACWCEQGTTFRSGSIYLTAGQIVPADIWYYENGGGAAVQFYWYTNGSWQIVPTSMMATSASYWGPSITGTGGGTVITTTTSGSTVYTYSQPVIITYYSDGTTSTANNGNPTLLSTTTTGGSSGATTNQQSSVSSAQSQQANLPRTSHIYIDQIGSNDKVTINQQNQYNLIGGQSQTGMKLRGGNNTVTIHQGDPTNTASTHNVAGIDLLGGSNTLTVNQGTDSNGNGIGTDTGYNYSSVYVNGVNNYLNIQQQSTTNTVGNYASINVTGNQNNIGVIQTGSGGKQFFTTVTGNQNTETVSQTGLGQHFLDIDLSGNGNSAVVNQSGATANSATISLINAGGPASVNLTQTGGQSYGITQMCVSVAGCGTVTVRQGN